MSSLPLYTIGVFAQPLAEEFGWGIDQIMLGLVPFCIVTVISAPMAGYLSDRCDVRKVALNSMLTFAMGMMLFSLNNGSHTLYLFLWGLLSALSAGTLLITFTKAISRWISGKRGFALGIALVGTGIGGAMAKLIAEELINAYGWRFALEPASGPPPLAQCTATPGPTIKRSTTACGASSSARWRCSYWAATEMSNSRPWSDRRMKPNPALKRINPSGMPEDIAMAWEASMALRGDATFFEVFANHPDLFRWYVGSFYGEVFRGGIVAQRFKGLLRLRLSTLHGCRLCNQGNRWNALAAGLTEEQIDAFDDPEKGPFTGAKRAVLALGEQLALTQPEGALNPALHRKLAQHFSDAEILELRLVGGISAGVAKFIFAFDLVEIEDTFPFHPSGEL